MICPEDGHPSQY